LLLHRSTSVAPPTFWAGTMASFATYPESKILGYEVPIVQG